MSDKYLVTDPSRVVVCILKSDEASSSATIKTVLKKVKIVLQLLAATCSYLQLLAANIGKTLAAN